MRSSCGSSNLSIAVSCGKFTLAVIFALNCCIIRGELSIICAVSYRHLNKDADELDELYVFKASKDAAGKWTTTGLDAETYFLVNTSGRVVDNKGRSKDGNDYYFVTGNKGQILAIYLED